MQIIWEMGLEAEENLCLNYFEYVHWPKGLMQFGFLLGGFEIKHCPIDHLNKG